MSLGGEDYRGRYETWDDRINRYEAGRASESQPSDLRGGYWSTSQRPADNEYLPSTGDVASFSSAMGGPLSPAAQAAHGLRNLAYWLENVGVYCNVQQNRCFDFVSGRGQDLPQRHVAKITIEQNGFSGITGIWQRGKSWRDNEYDVSGSRVQLTDLTDVARYLDNWLKDAGREAKLAETLTVKNAAESNMTVQQAANYFRDLLKPSQYPGINRQP